MSMTAAFLTEFENEAKTTRKVLERVPADKLSWKPHPKSMSLGELALHVAASPAVISGWCCEAETMFTGAKPPEAAIQRSFMVWAVALASTASRIPCPRAAMSAGPEPIQ